MKIEGIQAFSVTSGSFLPPASFRVKWPLIGIKTCQYSNYLTSVADERDL